MGFFYRSAVSLLYRRKTYERRQLTYSSIIYSLLENAKGNILDIGTGTGSIFDLLHPKSEELMVGLDVDRTAVKSLGKRRFNAVIADAEHMPFRDGIFHATLLISCIEHLSCAPRCVKEIKRVTVENGSCIVQLPNLQWPIEPHTKFPLLGFMPNPISSVVKKSESYNSLYLSTSLKKVLVWFSQAGFANVARQKIYPDFHFLRIFPWPLGWFLVFRKIK